MAHNTFSQYKTNPDKERNGVLFETRGGGFFCRRKGTSNLEYMKELERRFRKLAGVCPIS